MQYFHYTYEHGALKWNSHVYKIGTYHYNWHREPEILVLLKGRLELSCHGQAYEMNPLDVAIISPQMGHATLALEPDTIGFVLHFSVHSISELDSIGHIAIQCGFPDIKAFNMVFKKHFSMTPSAYRDHVKRFGTPTRIHNWKQMVSVDDADTLALLASMVKEDSMVETLVDDTYKKKYEALQAAIAKLQDI